MLHMCTSDSVQDEESWPMIVPLKYTLISSLHLIDAWRERIIGHRTEHIHMIKVSMWPQININQTVGELHRKIWSPAATRNKNNLILPNLPLVWSISLIWDATRGWTLRWSNRSLRHQNKIVLFYICQSPMKRATLQSLFEFNSSNIHRELLYYFWCRKRPIYDSLCMLCGSCGCICLERFRI